MKWKGWYGSSARYSRCHSGWVRFQSPCVLQIQTVKGQNLTKPDLNQNKFKQPGLHQKSCQRCQNLESLWAPFSLLNIRGRYGSSIRYSRCHSDCVPLCWGQAVKSLCSGDTDCHRTSTNHRLWPAESRQYYQTISTANCATTKLEKSLIQTHKRLKQKQQQNAVY